MARVQITPRDAARGGEDSSPTDWVSAADLSDPVLDPDLRKELGLGQAGAARSTAVDGRSGLEAKFHIAELLDVPIDQCGAFRP